VAKKQRVPKLIFPSCNFRGYFRTLTSQPAIDTFVFVIGIHENSRRR
jgi:hypothetical protein